MIGGDEKRELERLRDELKELRAEVEELKADTDVPPDPVAEAQAEKGKRRRRFRLIKGGGAVAAGAWIGEHWRQATISVLAASATGGAFVVLPAEPGPDEEVRIPPATTRPTPTMRPTPGHSTVTIPPTPGGKPDRRTYETPGRTDTTLTPTLHPPSPTVSPSPPRARRTTTPTRSPTPILTTGTLPPTVPTKKILPPAAAEQNLCAVVLVTICVRPTATPSE